MEPYQQLEQEWAKFNDLDPVGMVACSSGTAALHLALEAFQLPQGAKVLVPDYTMIACPRAVTMAGLVPVFVDCESNLLINVELACRAVREEAPVYVTMAAHIYGRTCGMCTLAKDGTAYIVEDLAEAHGVKPHPRTDAACWSFYRNKIVHGEEGGAVWFRDQANARLARSLRSLGFTDKHDFTHIPRGHNYRMSNAHARLILANLHAHIADIFDLGMTGRRKVEGWYDLCCPASWRMPPRDVPWVYDLRIPGMDWLMQNTVVLELRKHGVEARHGFVPCHKQDEYRECQFVKSGTFATSSLVWTEVVYLPIHPGMREDDCRRAFEVIHGCVGGL